MYKKNDDSLLFTCGLIEYIGRTVKRKRNEVVDLMGKVEIQRIYDFSDVLHCEPIEKIADECISRNGIEGGFYDNISKCAFLVPSAFDIGKVYERLIEDVLEESNIIDVLVEVYHSPLSEAICDYNRAVYYQSRQYLASCYRSHRIL